MQFVLRIWANLFGTFPSGESMSEVVAYPSDPALTAHYVVAVATALLGTVLVAVSRRLGPRRSLFALTVAGLVAVMAAVLSGIAFILSGYSNNVASFSMALAFIAAMAL